MSSPAVYPKFHAFDPSTGLPLVGGKLFTYAAGTATPQATYTDAGLTTPNANPIILDANGEAAIYVGPLAYKFVLQRADGSAVWTFDNYAPNVAAQTASEWNQYAGAVAYLGVASFKTTGADTTAIFNVGRRVKAVVTAGTVYGTVKTASFAAGDTTITLVMDGASALDAGLSAVYSGLLSYANPSYLDPRTAVSAYFTADVTGYAAITQLSAFTKTLDALSELAGGTFTAKYPGNYLINLNTCSKDSTAGNIAQVSFIRINGGTVSGASGVTASAGQFVQLGASIIAALNAGDTVTFFFNGTATSTVSANGFSGRTTNINIMRIP